MRDEIYVAGGIYHWDNAFGEYEAFRLVSPGGPKTLPYVRRKGPEMESFWCLTKHHAHLYRLSEDLKTCHLVRKSPEAEAGEVWSPELFDLDPDDIDRVARAVNEMEIDDGPT